MVRIVRIFWVHVKFYGRKIAGVVAIVAITFGLFLLPTGAGRASDHASQPGEGA